MNQVNIVFTEAYEKCKITLPFNKNWSNKTGMFDMAVYGEHAPKLSYGEMARSVTDGGRRIIILGTRLGNLVVFDRFSKQAEGEKGADTAVFYYDCSSSIRTGGWFSRNHLDAFEMGVAVGDSEERPGDGNLGWRLEQLFSALKNS